VPLTKEQIDLIKKTGETVLGRLPKLEKRRKGKSNPHVELNPTDSSKDPSETAYTSKRGVAGDKLARTRINEDQVTVRAKSAKTGRTIVKRYRDSASAREAYRKWLQKRHLHDVQLTDETLYDTDEMINEATNYKITARTSNKSLGKLAVRKDALGRQAKAELARRLKLRADA